MFGNDYRADIPGNTPFYQVTGESVHEVAVGPVHAGIIEPGHFRFQCAGEEVLHLEIQLGYQHRGVEQLLTAVPFGKSIACTWASRTGYRVSTPVANAAAQSSASSTTGP